MKSNRIIPGDRIVVMEASTVPPDLPGKEGIVMEVNTVERIGHKTVSYIVRLGLAGTFEFGVGEIRLRNPA